MFAPVAEPVIVAADVVAPEVNVKPPKVMPLAFTDVNAVEAAVNAKPALPETVIVLTEFPSKVTESKKVPVGDA